MPSLRNTPVYAEYERGSQIAAGLIKVREWADDVEPAFLKTQSWQAGGKDGGK